ncbi:hypothetical protein [Nocardiopsis nanhaiensis]
MTKHAPDAIELPTTRDNPFDPPEELLALGRGPHSGRCGSRTDTSVGW